MQHGPARSAIAAIMEDDAFGERATALTLAAHLADINVVPDAVRVKALERSAAMALERPPVFVHTLSVTPVPGDQRGLCEQLVPLIIEYPAQSGMQAASLAALCALWPHAASSERAPLRQKLINTVAARQAPAGSTVSSQQLRAWQRDLPTAHGESPGVAGLKSLLDEPQPQLAYHALAEHLGSNLDVATLSWVLGALSIRMLLHYRDRDGFASQVVFGAVACDQIARWTPPEHIATMISQQAIHLWWCRHRAELPPIRSCLDTSPRPLTEAIRSGDITSAQRAARNAIRIAPEFWQGMWELLGEWSEQDDQRWLRGLGLISAVSYRTGANAIAPDDAAALGSVFADMGYNERTAIVN